MGCVNEPGVGFPIQVDHVVRRTHRPDLIGYWRNNKVTCGCHNRVDFTESGSHTTPRERLRYVRAYWPGDSEWAEEAMRPVLKRGSTASGR